MFHSLIPKQFWGNVILITTYIINRLSTSLLYWKISYKTLLNTKPEYSSIKVFGCLCYAANTLPHEDKFQSRALKCIFIGYPIGRNGHLLYVLALINSLCLKILNFMRIFYPTLPIIPHIVIYQTPLPIPVHDYDYMYIDSDTSGTINAPSALSDHSLPLNTYSNMVMSSTHDNTLNMSVSSTQEMSHTTSYLQNSIYKPPQKVSQQIKTRNVWLHDYVTCIRHGNI